ILSKRVSLNIIGAGFIANELARALMMLDHVEIYGVYSRSIEKAREFARRHNINNIYDDWRRAVSDPHVEAVIIATPNYTHKEISVELLEEVNIFFLRSLSQQDM
ncbi:MAG: Gfo/Idh/MocA family oxidoreductase, partial [Desulfurococcaceae archaeon]|nr:Gfo/Idh/MocA family oxidoreductase [Desulfurococcaceae archaeon]